MPAMSGIDRTIEDHRRDPDPHPRWRKQIDEALAQLGAQIDALTPTNDMPEIPLPGTSTPKPVEHGVDPAVGSKTVFSREDHQHQLILPPVLEHMAAIAGPGVVQADGDDNLTAVQKASGRVAVWDEEGMTARDGLDWDDATTTLEPRNDFTMEADPLSDHYGRGTISKSSGWLFSTWSEPGGPGGHWLVNDYTVGGNRTVTVTYGATIGGGDCGFSVKLYLGLPSGSPKHTLDLPLGRIRIFQDQDTLYVKNAAGTNLWSRALPTASDAEEWVTIAVTVSGSTATVYQNGVEVATGTATAGTATGATITFANWNFPNQWRSCGFCELVIWDRLPNEADLLAARTRTRPVAGTTPNRLNIGPDADLRMIDHAAATRRVQTAMPDGTLTPEDRAIITEAATESNNGTGGSSWSYAASATSNRWQDAAFGNNMFVAVAGDGSNRILTSPDGMTWTARVSTDESAFWQTVSFGGGLFVAMATNGSCMTSPDGIVWTPRTVAALQWQCVRYGDGVWIAIANNGSTSNQIYRSTDGISWSPVTTPVAINGYTVIYGGGVWLALSLTANATAYLRSTNGGTSWTQHVGWTGTYYCGVWTGTHFCVFASGATTDGCRRSTDGLTWSSVTMPNTSQKRRVATQAGMLVVAHGTAGTNDPCVSYDHGASWVVKTLSPIAGHYWATVAIGANKIILLTALSGTTGQYGCYSSAGIVAGSNATLELGPSLGLRVIDHAGTGQRMVTADAEGDYTPVSEVVWTGTWLQINAKDVAAVNTTGLIARTGAGAFSTRSITGTAHEVLVTNGDGVSGNPTIRAPQPAITPNGPAVPPAPSAPASFGGFPRAPLAIPANQHRVNVLAASLGV